MNKIPLTEVSTELLAEMRERVWMYTASIFAIDGSTPRYKGTATLTPAQFERLADAFFAEIESKFL